MELRAFLSAMKKDKYRRKGKGHRCCLGGAEFIKFLAALAILHEDDLKNRMNSSFSFKSSWSNSAYYTNRPSAQ